MEVFVLVSVFLVVARLWLLLDVYGGLMNRINCRVGCGDEHEGGAGVVDSAVQHVDVRTELFQPFRNHLVRIVAELERLRLGAILNVLLMLTSPF